MALHHLPHLGRRRAPERFGDDSGTAGAVQAPDAGPDLVEGGGRGREDVDVQADEQRDDGRLGTSYQRVADAITQAAVLAAAG